MTETDRTWTVQLVEIMCPGSKLLRAWPLSGGVSAQVTALDVLLPDAQTRRLVVRQHGQRDLNRNPRIAADEYRLLQVLQASGVPAPQPHFLDQTCKVLPTPCLVVGYIEGETGIAPHDAANYLRELAAALTRIHTVETKLLDFLPRGSDQVSHWLASRLASHRNQGIIALLRAAWPWSRPEESVLLHGDYWPGNVLWRDGKLVGVIDWEDAKLGDPLVDVANSRLELLWALGAEAMDSFTCHYRETTARDLVTLSYWDLWVALSKLERIGEWGLDKATEQQMRAAAGWFVRKAIEEIGQRPQPW